MIREILDWMLPFLDGVPAIRVILSFILVFLLPGFSWTLVFFSNIRQINVVERLVLSFGLSIAVVALGLLTAYLFFGVSITGTNALLVILPTIIVPVAWYCLLRIIRKRKAGVS